MVGKTVQTVDISFRSVAREVEGDDEFMCQAHHKAWRELSRLSSSQTYRHDSVVATVDIDWSAIARRLLELGSKTKQAPPRFIDLAANVSISGNSVDELNAESFSEFIVVYHLSNVFLAMNISAPGSADFMGVQVDCRGGSSDPELDISGYDSALDISGYDYDYAWTISRQGKWPEIREVPLEACFQWLAPMEDRIVQVARSSFERLVLSVLRIAQMDSTPDSIIWICAGLESLIPTTMGKARKQISDGISSLLGATEEQQAMLDQYLRDIYELRNSFAHGNLPITHPFSNELFDQQVLCEFDRYVDLHEDGVRILLAAIQESVLQSPHS